ncbi:hypothetical protein HN789_04245 [archaeon]|nr:hypothetical protein [archaeon]MBT4271850.1 hypothetical protein [archaeon]MBT4460738.1 hypothetical protein [archaeon]MBT4859097.1 hypothetical protein [archaeon]MBT5424439.1 hypothetical protein [archaeon]
MILISSFSYAEIYKKFIWENEQNQPVTDVIVIGWKCVDESCVDVTSMIPSLAPNGKSSGGNSFYDVTLAEPGIYLLRFFPSNYLSGRVKFAVSGTGRKSDYTINSLKIAQNCKAEFTQAIQSCAEAGFPISILTDTELEATTQSALSTGTSHYPSPEYNDWINATTNMFADVKKVGASTSESGFPKTDTWGISGSTTHDFEFLWETSKDTAPGQYEITMISTVPDNKCDQATMVPVEQTMTITLSPSPDTCRCEISDFSVSQSELTDTSYRVNFNGKKLMEFQDWDYTYIDECNLQDTSLAEVFMFMSDYTLTITDRDSDAVAYTVTDRFGKNAVSNTPQDFTVSWETTNPGDYSANLSVVSIDTTNKCNNFGTSTSQVKTFQIGEDLDNDDHYVTSNNNNEDCDDSDNTIYDGATEIPDGKDNDCDGQTDEGFTCTPGDSKPCSEIFHGICGVGQADCVNGQWQGCPAAQNEVCDNDQDDDCDDFIDCADIEDCTSFFEQALHFYPCQYSPGDISCESGYGNANKDASDGCECEITNFGKEKCDGDDNDCNGVIDDLADKDIPLCDEASSGLGICKDQKKTCVGGEFICLDIKQNETCDLLDNDCDGKIDETCDLDKDNYANISIDCINSFIDGNNIERACNTFGTDCDDSNNVVYPGQEEICDQIDHNCNGQVAEGCECNEGDPIGCDPDGVCAELELFCGLDGFIPSCDYSSLLDYEVTETKCDGKDNDCDGKIDQEDGLANCCSTGATKSCIKTCADKKQIQGSFKCENNEWGNECVADCGDNIVQSYNLEINVPVADLTYKTCYDETYIKLDYDFDGSDSCRYKLNTGQYKGVTDTIKAKKGQNDLTLKCGDTQKSIIFHLINQDSCEQVDSVVDDDTIDTFEEEGDGYYSDEDLLKGEETGKHIEQSYSFSYDEESGMTDIEINLNPQKNLGEANYHLYIPKCLAEYIDEIEFEVEDYKIIKEDSIIAWHFAEMDRPANFNYRVKGKISKDCLENIKGMAIADMIDYTEPSPMTPILIGVLIVLAIVATVWMEVKFNKLHLGFNKPKTGSNEETIQALKYHWEDRIKAQGFANKDQAKTYMEQLNLPKDVIEHVLKNFK